MFFAIYLRRELRRRMRQAIFIALGLALGIGLVITVTAASSGVKKAQAEVLKSLYGVGTDVTVTGKAPKPVVGRRPQQGGQGFQMGPGGAQVCTNGKCRRAGGQTIDRLSSSSYGPISATKVAAIANLSHVKAAAGGLALTETSIKLPKNFGQPGGTFPTPTSFSVQGVDTGHLSLGTLSAGTISKGRSLRGSDATSNVAVIDSGYAKSNKLKVGSTVRIVKHPFTVVGIVEQPQSGSPPQVYIPLARAQALATSFGGTSLKGDVNTIYVTADSAADIPAVQSAIKSLLPGDTVTSASNLASQVTGSLSNTAKLADELGRWLSIVVLIAAFALACLLTMAAVARRVREFGTLKALGWPTRRIVGQVMAESVTIGIVGGAVGVALGFAGAAIISAVAPSLSATVGNTNVPRFVTAGGPPGGGGFAGGRGLGAAAASHTVAVPMSASVTVAALVAAVVLAVAGGLLAGTFGSWRITRLRPADALTRVA
jgi:putative ABC transport system permease protein